MAKKIIAVLLCLAMVLAFAACSNTSDKTDTSDSSAASDSTAATEEGAAADDVAEVKEAGKLVVGITEFEPMDYKDEDGNWIGFDADMATAFAEYLGVDVEFQEIDWDNKLLELNNGNIDCVWNGMTLTDEVTSSMACSEPYCNNAQVVIVKAADADKYQTAEDCKDLKFAVEKGSAGKEMADENGFDAQEVQDQATALMEVAAGTRDAAIIDSLMAAAMVGEGTSYADLTYTVQLNSEEYGVGFRQNSDLLAAYADFFAAAKEDGTLQTVAEKYGVQAALIAD